MRQYERFGAQADAYSSSSGHLALYVLGTSFGLTAMTGVLFVIFL